MGYVGKRNGKCGYCRHWKKNQKGKHSQLGCRHPKGPAKSKGGCSHWQGRYIKGKGIKSKGMIDDPMIMATPDIPTRLRPPFELWHKRVEAPVNLVTLPRKAGKPLEEYRNVMGRVVNLSEPKVEDVA